MVTATASDGRLRVRLDGSDAVWAFKRRLDVPLSGVREVRVTDDLAPWLGWRHNELGVRLPGSLFPGLIAAGSYWSRRSGWTFCCLRRNQRALIVDLEPGAGRYRRLVLGVEDADGALARINSARPAACACENDCSKHATARGETAASPQKRGDRASRRGT